MDNQEKEKKTLAQQLYDHFIRLHERLPELPAQVEWLLPFQQYPETAALTRKFLDQYYSDVQPRHLILGINPGRFGAGLTNIAFTDPLHLKQECGIYSSFPEKAELSAVFIYEVVRQMGGPTSFYQKFFVNSVVPFGFIREGRNFNYYDDRSLQSALEPLIRFHLAELRNMGMMADRCFCLGEDKNYKFLSILNEREQYFEAVIPLPHPRFIMQYRRRQKESYVRRYLDALCATV